MRKSCLQVEEMIANNKLEDPLDLQIASDSIFV